MMDLMNRITDKEGWRSKVLDENIAGRWKTEARSIQEKDVSEKMVDWVSTKQPLYHCLRDYKNDSYCIDLTWYSALPSYVTKLPFLKDGIMSRQSMEESSSPTLLSLKI